MNQTTVAPASGGEWRTIDSAPKDIRIDLWHPAWGRYTDAYWCDQGWTTQSLRTISGVTHWRHRPAPPGSTSPSVEELGKLICESMFDMSEQSGDRAFVAARLSADKMLLGKSCEAARRVLARLALGALHIQAP